MKKLALMVGAALLLTSCGNTVLKTARTTEAPVMINTATFADLEIAPDRVNYTYEPTNTVRKGGLENVKQAAVQEILRINGNADLLIDPMYVVRKNSRGKVLSVVVSGRPARYRNFRSGK